MNFAFVSCFSLLLVRYRSVSTFVSQVSLSFWFCIRRSLFRCFEFLLLYDSSFMCRVVAWLAFLSIFPCASDISQSLPALSVSLSFSSSPVATCWALVQLFAVSDTLRSLGPGLLGFRWFATFLFHNQKCLQKQAPASSVFSFADFPGPPTCFAALLSSTSLPVLSGTSSRVLVMSSRGSSSLYALVSEAHFSACAVFRCSYMPFLATSWSFLVSTSCRCFVGV